MDMLNDEVPDEAAEVMATFKAIKIINAQSIETTKKNNLDFRITHRFGNIGGGGHTLFGLDQAQDVRLSFDYGLTDNLSIGIGRSKVQEHVDGSIKFAFLKQKKDHMPITAVIYSDMAISAQKSDTVSYSPYYEEFGHRITYVTHLIVARKFNKSISVEILPTWVHRNKIDYAVNADNGAEEQNDIFALGFGARVKITKRMAIVADYFLIMSDFRKDNSANSFADPLAIGIEN